MNLDQAKGMFVGLAVGDALGTTLEFSRPSPDDVMHTEMTGGGPFGLPPGVWTDDTSLAVAMAASIINKYEFDPSDMMYEFINWQHNGMHSPMEKCFDIGSTTSTALSRGGDWFYPYQCTTEDNASGNGGIMRMAPIVILNHKSYEDALIDSVRASMLTHGNQDCVRYAQAMAAVLFHGRLDDVYGEEMQIPQKFCDMTGNPYSGGYVAETYSAACHAVKTTSSFEDAIIQAVNYRFDADTTGAVAGQIAGSIYGMNGIPKRWLDTLQWRDKIEDMAVQLWEMSPVKN